MFLGVPFFKQCARQRFLSHNAGIFALLAALVINDTVLAQPAPTASEIGAPVSAQTAAEAVNPLDNSVFALESTATLGQKDAAALLETAAYSSALGGGKRWPGMQATGTITYAGDPTQHSATLTNRGHQEFRLDVQASNGTESIRVQGRRGSVREGGKTIPIDPDTALLGIFPFEIVGNAIPEATTTSLVDRGTVTSGGQSLHRVTLSLPSLYWNPVTKSQGALPIDLYFDPVTHLLIKTVCNVYLPGMRHVPFLSVVTYGDYRTVGTAVIPFQYSENINGHPYQTLQLTSVQLNPAISADYFQFERPEQ